MVEWTNVIDSGMKPIGSQNLTAVKYLPIHEWFDFVWVNVKQIFTSPMDPIVSTDTLPFEVPFLLFSSLFSFFSSFLCFAGKK